MVDKIRTLPGHKIAKQIKSGKISPVTVVDAFLNRIQKRNEVLNAFITVLEDEARSAAKDAERAVKEGKDLGPLHGVPVAVKDSMDVAGAPTTYGSRLFTSNIADDDDLLVKRIKDAGGIIIGKTNMPQFARGGTTENNLRDPTPTPFDLSRTAGGSSGGSASAAADGMAPFTVGSDAGGSIRIPAAFCGVFGLKPSFGRIPNCNRPFAFSHVTPMSAWGPITRSIKDAALMMEVLAGPHPQDPLSIPDGNNDYLSAIQQIPNDVSVAYCPNLDVFPVDDSVSTIVTNAVNNLKDIDGVNVTEVEIDLQFDQVTILETMYDTWVPISYSLHNVSTKENQEVDLFENHQDELTEHTIESIKRGRSMAAMEYALSDQIRSGVYDGIQDVFEKHNFIVSPTVAVPPFDKSRNGPKEINGVPVEPNEWHLTLPYNFSGHPVASIPAGFTDDDLPVGLQVAGRRFADDEVLAICSKYENSYSWNEKYPI